MVHIMGASCLAKCLPHRTGNGPYNDDFTFSRLRDNPVRLEMIHKNSDFKLRQVPTPVGPEMIGNGPYYGGSNVLKCQRFKIGHNDTNACVT